MQNIKREFELVRGAHNIVSHPKKQNVENWYNKIHNIFSLLDNSFNHIGKKSILKIINDESKAKKIFNVVVFQQSSSEYHLPGCYDIASKIQLINIGFYQIEDISITKPSAKELYSSILYNYILYMIHSRKVKFNIDICYNIINYYTSMFMSLFGKQYGMTGIYTSKIVSLKLCISLYILSSYFGLKGKELYINAQSLSTYNIDDNLKLKLDSYNFENVNDFIKILSDLEVFPGFSIYKMMGRLYTSYGISFLAAFEDFGRFIAMLSVCMISGNHIVPSFIYKYNKQAFDGILKSMTMIYK